MGGVGEVVITSSYSEKRTPPSRKSIALEVNDNSFSEPCHAMEIVCCAAVFSQRFNDPSGTREKDLIN